ncbi:hypothetical protein ZYGR_0Z01540 [Zygosaccharomyces rouxii]|uniref:AAA+ ATPase domain-containing protein n=1 Tax=Zygosaccharomyces rouxii TaxID=4956 RepID=A0A1Q3A508_ZYGRO|nr:hypothetical protein ZYGR_0Z01540 [Zygosaccharomyces rouxii]
MDSTVPNCTSIGESFLFGGSGGEKESVKEVGKNDSNNGDREFVSGSGKVVRLRKRVNSSVENYGGSLWREDETYGININALLDKIESESASNGHHQDEEASNLHDNELWVEKWRPRRFIDLVGNEKTNRRVLRWLRQWSPAVFQESLPQPLYENEFDPLQRPAKRILLLHGPPGIGKTSVAHVIAKQAGYTVAEINASDERGGWQVRDKILNTLFNHTFNQSPVCLVADEIDGTLESGFIKVLIDVVNSDARATRKMGVPKKGKKNRDKLLLRPIIAVCNNLYAPALEKLKPLCEIVPFKRPSDFSLNERLDTICRVEGVKIHSKSLKDLIDLSQGDVRNCVNNLQFWATGTSSQASSSSMDTDPMGKDFSSSWYGLVNSIFQRDPHRESRDQLSSLSQQIELNGNYDRIVQGCHSIFPRVKYSDNGVIKPSRIADWLYFHDLMNKSLYQHNGELMRYCAAVPLQFAHMFGDIANKEDIQVKNSQYEFNELRKFTMDITNCIAHQTLKRSPAVQTFTSRQSLIFETLPYLDSMISADVSKCKNLKVKQAIYDNLAELLNFYQLNVVARNHDSLEGKKILSIDPPLDQIVLLDNKRKQEVLSKRPGSLNFLLAKFEENKARKRHVDQTMEKREREDEVRVKRSKTAMASGNTVDFFKTQYGINEPNKLDTEVPISKHQEDEIRTWVRYKEGFSDAVRKNVAWSSLWS